MKVRNIDLPELTAALQTVNEAKGYSLSFNRFPERKGRWLHFTIKSPSGIRGARIAASGRNTPSASWHAHGHLFEEILHRCPDAIIDSGGHRITKDGGNWQDIPMGSPMCPVMMSELSIL